MKYNVNMAHYSFIHIPAISSYTTLIKWKIGSRNLLKNHLFN